MTVNCQLARSDRQAGWKLKSKNKLAVYCSCPATKAMVTHTYLRSISLSCLFLPISGAASMVCALDCLCVNRYLK